MNVPFLDLRSAYRELQVELDAACRRGMESGLDPIQTSFLRVKLKHLDNWNWRRRNVAQRYLEALKGCPDLILPSVARGAEPAWHLFVLRLATEVTATNGQQACG